MKKLYIIAGPNGAGKTTASYTILPEIFNCKEFVNADEIARGISPFNSENVSIQAGRIMLKRISELLEKGNTFALETTLSTKSYIQFIKKAKENNYEIILLFLRLNSSNLAIQRVKTRVEEGGHNIPTDVIIRRYNKGLSNLFQLYIAAVDKWFLVDNSGEKFEFIAEGTKNETIIKNKDIWLILTQKYYGN
ncbi:MAG: zeta toxin [Flavobacteriales bacterium]|nr:MAG: zeta toxin [Flavobacteriales bacterium]